MVVDEGHLDQLGLTPVERVGRAEHPDAGVLALDQLAGQARPAVAASDHAGDQHLVTFGEGLDVGAGGDDPPDELVPGTNAGDQHRAVVQVQVRAADGGVAHLDDGCAGRLDGRFVDVGDLDLMGTGHHRCSHHRTLFERQTSGSRRPRRRAVARTVPAT